ncbi:TetR/AcrR family transcriptional regulator [Pseudonocardia acaciae]|uniref:TetR/AcrR family transcriptional regulator n=1 Tax=Pseudonocardia acaciae TaxID=551276 RepID=UPI00048CB8A8|nr:TetR/AcrR family transcriptional regulator [Pseudonocardia acaciae]
MTTTSLPRGRHKLSREEVAAAQRSRILRGMADAMTDNGYAGTVVADIIKRAGVSRETFYQQFASKQDCFVAALEAAIERLAAALAPARPGGGTPVQQLDRIVGAYLDALAAEPATARLFLIETYAAGPEAMRRRLALQRRFIDGLAEIVGARTERERFACEALVATLVSLVTARFVEDDPAGLPGLREPIVTLAAQLLARDP